MDILSQLRQDPAAFSSSLVVSASVDGSMPTAAEPAPSRATLPPADGGAAFLAALPTMPPLDCWQIPLEHAGPLGVVDVIAFPPGVLDGVGRIRRMVEGRPGEPGDGPSVVGQSGPPTPRRRPHPCFECGCPFWWQQLGDADGSNLKCCECVAIPSRRMVVAAWMVVWRRSTAGMELAAWAPYRPDRWRPFAHLEERESVAREAAVKEAKGGF